MNLQEWMGRQHSLPEQLAVIEGLCTAINEDHQKRILHRALEPANIEVLADGRCNLQQAVRPEAASASAAARYRAPEILEGASYSPKADIYSVGVICYEMLSGRTPSENAPPRPLSELRPELSRDLTDGIMGCLERGPDWRPGDLSYLLQVVGQLRGSSARARPAKEAEPPVQAAPPPRKAAARGPSSRSRLPLVAVALAIAAAGGVGAWLWLRSQGERAPGQHAAAPPPTPVPTMAPPPTPTPEPRTPPTATATPASKPAEKPPASTPEPPRQAPPRPSPATIPTPTPRPAPQAAPAATQIYESPPTPTPPPRVEPPAEPAVLTTLSPLTLKRPTTAILDLRGLGLRPDHQARVLKVKAEPNGITIVRQKYGGPTLIQVVVKIEETAAPGVYGMGVADARGTWSNSLSFTVTR